MGWACPGRPRGPGSIARSPAGPAQTPNSQILEPVATESSLSFPSFCSTNMPQLAQASLGRLLAEQRAVGKRKVKASWLQLRSPDPPHHASAFQVRGREADPSSLGGGGTGTRLAQRGPAAAPRCQAASAQGRAKLGPWPCVVAWNPHTSQEGVVPWLPGHR